MTIEQQSNEILKRYLQLAEKEYGKLPQHCYETKIEFFITTKKISGGSFGKNSNIHFKKFQKA